jgi:long-subunit fatty acid transport protein
VSFLSFVYPGKKWSLALYRHQLAEFRINTEINGLFAELQEGWATRYDDQLSTTSLDIVGTGISGAYQVAERLSIGLSVTFYSGRVESAGATYAIDSYPETFWERNSFLPHRQEINSSFSVDDTDIGFNIGILWSFAENWRLGGVYRGGPRFDYELFNIAGPLNEQPEGTILASVLDRSIAFPDVWGVGVAYRSPGGSVTVGFEWDRVEYTIILESLASSQVDTTDVSVGNADELRLGCEYVFMKSRPLIAIRGGVWHDPDHRFRYDGDDPFTRALYPPGGDTTHFTVGTGVAFNHFQIDVGADFSDFADTFTLSAIYSF